MFAQHTESLIPLGRLPVGFCEHASYSRFAQPGAEKPRSWLGVLVRQNMTNKTTVSQKDPL